MICYRSGCDSDDLRLAPLTPYERDLYIQADIVMRVCGRCGLEQNHVGDGEPLTAWEATQREPDAVRQ